MIKRQFTRFVLRWFVNSLGLWIAQRLFSTVLFEESLMAIVGAGLVLSIVNALIKPLLVILTLPAVLLSLGLFMIIINGVVVLIADYFYGPLEVTTFGGAILAGMVIGLVNYAITWVFDEK
jgi:putative membrane protein